MSKTPFEANLDPKSEEPALDLDPKRTTKPDPDLKKSFLIPNSD